MQTFIFGHRNPDTDSICSSIALSYLKNALGYKTVGKLKKSSPQSVQNLLNEVIDSICRIEL